MTMVERAAARMLIDAWNAVQTTRGIRVEVNGREAERTWQIFCDHLDVLRDKVRPPGQRRQEGIANDWKEG